MRDNRERGSSVLELSVTMGLLALVAVPMFTFMQTAGTRQQQISSTSTALGQGRLAIARIQREVRSARSLSVGAAPASVVAWRDLNDDGIHDLGEDVTYSISGGSLIRDDGILSAPLLNDVDATSTLQLLTVSSGTALEVNLIIAIGGNASPITLHTEVIPRAT